MRSRPCLILDVFKQEHSLKAELFEEKHPAATLRYYSQIEVSFPEIEDLCREIVAILNKSTPLYHNQSSLSALKKTGRLLWEHLLPRQVREKLRASPLPELLLSIDEELIHIPWELLFDGENFLCLEFNMGRLVRSKRELQAVQYRGLPEKIKMLILANPTHDLKSAYNEGLDIKNQFQRRHNLVHVDFKSTQIDKLYVKKNLCDYDIVHYAGHGDYDPRNPENSGWLLSDGKFNLKSVLNMGQVDSMPALVFSNACYSAAATALAVNSDYQEKNYNFAAAFLFAGVRHYIGAIRRIVDKASLVFAKAFYSQVILGKSVGEAMRLARLKLIDEYGQEDLQWINYILYGDPGFAFFKPKAPASGKKKFKLAVYRKKIILGFASLAVVSLVWFTWARLPGKSPGNMYLFLNSQAQLNMGNNQGAVKTGEKIIKDEPMFLAAYPIVANAYEKMGDRKKALDYYFDYALFSEKKHNKRHLAQAYIKLGWFYYTDGDYDKSFEFYHKALALSEQSGDRLNQAVALRKLAVWYVDKNEYDRALELLTKSSGINFEHQRSFEFRKNLACDYFDIGLVFADKNDYPAAKEFYLKSKKLFEKLKLNSELSDCYFNLGEIYMFEKEYQAALDNYLRGLKIDEKQGNKANLSGDYAMIGELYVEMGDSEKAEKYFLDAVKSAENINHRQDLANAFDKLGLLYKSKGWKNKARDCWRRSQEIYKQTDPEKLKQVKENLLNLE